MSSSQPPKISFYKYIGTFGASGGGGGGGSAEKINEGNAKIECFETTNNDYITFETSGDSSNHERMRIDKDGNIGIGITTPFNKLDVNGTIKATGSLTDGITSLFHGSITGVKSFQLIEGASANKILTSDANGNATWQTNSGGGGGGNAEKITDGNAKIECFDTSGADADYIKFYTLNFLF